MNKHKMRSLINVETRNLLKASNCAIQYLNRIKKFRLPRSFFNMVHRHLLANDPHAAGRYRRSVDFLEIPKATFTPTPAWLIESEMLNLLEIINNKRKWHPLFRKYFVNKINKKQAKQILGTKLNKDITYRIFMAWYFHHRFVIIHPFNDGNGRMARLLMCLILREVGLSEFSFPPMINLIIKYTKHRYLDSLNSADKNDYIEGTIYLFKTLSKAYTESAKIKNEKIDIDLRGV